MYENRVLVLGATGMLGNALYRYLHCLPDIEVYGTTRTNNSQFFFTTDEQKNLLMVEDILDFQKITHIFDTVKPKYIINCIGIIKQKEKGINRFNYLMINTLLPQFISQYCNHGEAQLIHFSTDCVFDGAKGNYHDDEPHTALDYYGRTKSLGEVKSQNCLTLRTSIIGHEVRSTSGLIDWFLSQDGTVSGFANAYFSGLPTIYISHLISQLITQRFKLDGVFNVSSDRISKLHLLSLVKNTYGLDIDIESVDKPVIDRSLNSQRFQAEFDWECPSWDYLVRMMHDDYLDVVKRRHQI